MIEDVFDDVRKRYTRSRKNKVDPEHFDTVKI